MGNEKSCAIVSWANSGNSGARGGNTNLPENYMQNSIKVLDYEEDKNKNEKLINPFSNINSNNLSIKYENINNTKEEFDYHKNIYISKNINYKDIITICKILLGFIFCVIIYYMFLIIYKRKQQIINKKQHENILV